MSEYMDVRTYEQMKYNADCFQAVWDELQEVRAERDRLREENETLKRRLRQAEQLLGDFPDGVEA